MSIEILQPFRPVLGAKAYDGGGREVIGWIHCSRPKSLLAWLVLLIERNVTGWLPYATNPEPWPGYYDGIQAAEVSHLNSPWYWNQVAEWIALATLANTLKDIRKVYPETTPEQVKEVLEDFDLFT
jgi:hypothetical protein